MSTHFNKQEINSQRQTPNKTLSIEIENQKTIQTGLLRISVEFAELTENNRRR